MADPPVYIALAEVAIYPGRFRDLWNAIGDPDDTDEFTAAQAVAIAEAQAEVDQITGQRGGLGAQSGVSVTLYPDAKTDSLALPNKPITAVGSITVFRNGASLPYDVGGDAIHFTDGQTIRYNVFGQASIPSGMQIAAFSLWGTYTPFAEGDEVTVTYDCGYADEDMPPSVKNAMRRILARNFLGHVQNAEGAQEVVEGRSRRRFGTQSYVDIARLEIERILEPLTIAVRQ